MKKIGILYGQENTFPFAVIDKINSMNVPGIMAEAVQVDKVSQGAASGYAVIIDRISQDIPFYRAYLKTAAITGTAVINNPFWWSADEKFFNNSIALSVGVPVPKTYLLPSNQMPPETNANSFRNLKYPMDWDGIVQDIGFPAYMKPHAGGGWKSVYRVENLDDLFAKHNETEQLVMMLQEEIVFEEYYRCYCIGGKYVRIMQYDPRNPHHLRYVVDTPPSSKALLDKIHDYVLRLNHALGYDFNTVEFAVRDGIPYAIDFCNPAPDADVASVGQENFDWVVETSARYAIERALAQKPGQDNLTWGTFVQRGVAGVVTSPAKKEKAAALPKAAKGKPGRKPKAVVATDAAPKKRGRPAAPKATASADDTAPKRRGRPAKAKVEGEAKEVKRRGRPAKVKAEGTEAPKRRGRPAKPKTAVTAEPKRRGRPAKVKAAATEAPKRRGRPAKPKAEGIATEPKRRGRPAKPKAEVSAEPKRRGRPAKVVSAADTVPAVPKRRGRPAKPVVPKEPKKRGPKAKIKTEVIAEKKPRKAKTALTNGKKEVVKRGRKPKAAKAVKTKRVKMEKPLGPLMGIDAVLAAEKLGKDSNL